VRGPVRATERAQRPRGRGRSIRFTVALALIALPTLSARSPLAGQAATAFAGAIAEAPAREPPARHVVLVSVDGLRPEFYRDERWPAPNLQEMAREGVHALAVRSVFPSVTYPAHTTMITGARPARHGILFNRPFEPGGPSGRWYWEEDSVRTRTLWDAVGEAGGETASVGWPVSVGAPVDRNVPEIWPLDPEADPIAPIRRHARPEGLVEEIEREATGRLTARNFTIEHMTRDDRAGAAAAYLLERYRPRLLTVHLVMTDHFQHLDGRDGPRVRRAVAAADRALGQIREAAERAGILERTAFVVTGDHGFVEVHSRLAPNVWLARAGLRGVDRAREPWRATFHTTGGAAFLRLADPADGEAEALARRALGALPQGVRRLFRVVGRPGLEAIGADPEAPLALAAEAGIVFGSRAEGPALEPARGGHHGHFPDRGRIHTGLVAWGSGVRAGRVVPKMDLVDVAPLVAALLDVEFEAPDGILLPGLLAGADE